MTSGYGLSVIVHQPGLSALGRGDKDRDHPFRVPAGHGHGHVTRCTADSAPVSDGDEPRQGVIERREVATVGQTVGVAMNNRQVTPPDGEILGFADHQTLHQLPTASVIRQRVGDLSETPTERVVHSSVVDADQSLQACRGSTTRRPKHHGGALTGERSSDDLYRSRTVPRNGHSPQTSIAPRRTAFDSNGTSALAGQQLRGERWG